MVVVHDPVPSDCRTERGDTVYPRTGVSDNIRDMIRYRSLCPLVRVEVGRRRTSRVSGLLVKGTGCTVPDGVTPFLPPPRDSFLGTNGGPSLDPPLESLLPCRHGPDTYLPRRPRLPTSPVSGTPDVSRVDQSSAALLPCTRVYRRRLRPRSVTFRAPSPVPRP